MNKEIDRFINFKEQNEILAASLRHINTVNFSHIENQFIQLENSRTYLGDYFEKQNSILLNVSNNLPDFSTSLQAANLAIEKNLLVPLPDLTQINDAIHLQSQKLADALSTIDMQDQLLDAHQITGTSISILKSISDFELQKLWGAEFTAKLLPSINDFGTAYEGVFKSLKLSDVAPSKIPSNLLESVAIEGFNQADLIAATSDSTERVEEEENSEIKKMIAIREKGLEGLLFELDPGLPKMLEGMREAYDAKGADWVRHFSVSARELFTHVMHILAPDKQLKEWSTSTSDYHNGKPTRQARLRYICRHVNVGEFTAFTEADCKAIQQFIDLFQNGTHAVSIKLSSSQLRAMKTRIETSIYYLIEVSEEIDSDNKR